MFVDEIRRAIEASSRVKLPEVSAALWRAFSTGQITEAEAENLSNLIEAKKAVSKSPSPAPRRVGSRPRTTASMERRRSWASSGRLPATLAARFTQGEVAVLVVLALEVKRAGDCRWPIGKLAAIAGVSVSTVKRALRAARDLGLIEIEQRRLSAWRSDTNVVTITSKAWIAWLRRGGGVQAWTATKNKVSPGSEPNLRDRGHGHRAESGVGQGMPPEASELAQDGRERSRATQRRQEAGSRPAAG